MLLMEQVLGQNSGTVAAEDFSELCQGLSHLRGWGCGVQGGEEEAGGWSRQLVTASVVLTKGEQPGHCWWQKKISITLDQLKLLFYMSQWLTIINCMW